MHSRQQQRAFDKDRKLVQLGSVKVSVIIPVYNVDTYLPAFLESLSRQDCAGAEYIFIDDGSTDESGKILDDFQKKEHSFVVIHQSNGGVARARNKGLEIARGEYLCFIDPDDQISDDYLNQLLNYAKLYSADFIFTDTVNIDKGKLSLPREIEFPKTIRHIDKNAVICEPQLVFYELLKGTSVGLTVWAKLFNKKLFNENLFPEQRTSSDSVPCFTAISRAKKIIYINGPRYYYRVDRPDSLQNTLLPKDIADSVDVHLSLQRFIAVTYPNLNYMARMNLSKKLVQVSIKICLSSAIQNRHVEFEKYNRMLSGQIIAIWKSSQTFKEKINATIVRSGYYPTIIAIKAKQAVSSFRRSLLKN